MKIIAQTNRGKLYIHETDNVEEKFTLIADWQFFRGKIISKEELNFDDLKRGFLWSQKKGFIEEDSSIIGVMIARGKKYGLSPEESVLKSDYLPTSSPFRQIIREDRKGTLKNNQNGKAFQPLNCSGRIIYPIVDNLEQLKKLFDAGASLIQFRVKTNHKVMFCSSQESCELSKVLLFKTDN